jgi:hypothetical protein
MRRFQIYLEPGMDAHLGRLSEKAGRPKAELIRESIGLYLERETEKLEDPILGIVGLAGEAGHPDASARHDDYLYPLAGKKRGKSRKDGP